MGTLIKIFLILILFIAIVIFIYVFILKKKVNKEEIMYHIEEFKKSRALVGSLCLVIALILSFVITPAFTTALNKRTKVLEIVKDIKIGEKLTDSMVREVEIGSYNLSKDLIKSKAEIKDMYATKDLYKGQYLYRTQISKDIPYEDNYLYGLGGLKRAISFSINKLSNGLSNKLMQGDIISIIVINQNEKEESKKAIIPDELKYIEVLTTTNNGGTDIERVDKTKEKDEIMYQTISVLASDEQAKIIAKAETIQQIYVELVYRPGDKEISNYLLLEQERILDDKYPERENKTIEENIIKLLNKKKNTNINETINPLNGINKTLEEEIENAKSFNSNNEENIEEETTEEYIEETKETETAKAIDETKKEPETKSINDIQKEEYERIKKELNCN